MYDDLKQYIARLERCGELMRISVPVDPQLEIAEICDRVSKSGDGGKALLFENTGTGFPVAVNLFGSRRRMALALGCDSLQQVEERLSGLAALALSPKNGWGDKLRMLPLLGEMSRWMPRRVSGRGACQWRVLRGGEARLSLLPVLRCWPCDGGRFVTLPMVHTADPQTGAPNVGMYRMQLFDDFHTGMHWHVHKTGARHYDACRRAGIVRMPVSVTLGGDPACIYAATAPVPDGVDEYLLAGMLRRRPVRLVRCITNDLWVPADCDMVIEGYVDTTEEKRVEGAFGDHTGFYSLEDLYPRFHVTAITHRRDAVYPATIVGVPPQEDAYVAEATERIFLTPMRLALQPEIEDLYMPPAGVAHNIALMSIDCRYRGQAEKVAHSMWGAGQMMFNKMLALFPAGARLRDPATVAAALRRMVPERDVHFGRGVLDVLDHATATCGYGGKVLFDFTAPERGELRPVRLPAEWRPAGGVTAVDDRPAAEWGAVLLGCAPGAAPDAERFLEANPMEGVRLAVLVDAAALGLDLLEIVWIASGNCDPARDMRLCGGVLVVDGRSKTGGGAGYPRRFPNVVTSSPETIALVDRRWREYGFAEFLPSPSLRYRPLLFSEEAGTPGAPCSGCEP